MNISSTFRLKVLIMIESKISEHFINDSDTVVDVGGQGLLGLHVGGAVESLC